MPMQAESLEVLEKASVAPAQARAIVRAIEIEIAGAKDTLATKHDVLVIGTDLRGEMAALRTGLCGEMAALRTELRGELAALKTELRAEMAALKTELRAELREQMAHLATELRVEIHRSVGGVTRQMYTAILGQMAVLLGFAYFFATHLR
jgi:hypothetical protein